MGRFATEEHNSDHWSVSLQWWNAHLRRNSVRPDQGRHPHTGIPQYDKARGSIQALGRGQTILDCQSLYYGFLHCRYVFRGLETIR